MAAGIVNRIVKIDAARESLCHDPRQLELAVYAKEISHYLAVPLPQIFSIDKDICPFRGLKGHARRLLNV